MNEDTSRVTCAAPLDSVEQGMHLSPEEDTAKLVVSVAIFPKNTNFKFITRIRTGLVEADDVVLNADTIFPDRVYLKQWKDPAYADARHIKVEEELESVKCYLMTVSIEISGIQDRKSVV